jgi:hypothetical protein
MSFTLNTLNETDFEDFCFDLLQSLDFVNLSWRKGTGLSSSPSDQGRDIQGELLRKDFARKQHHEKWFIECKHYIKGVPPDKILGAISWANAERPDVLLIIASNFLSNSTKNYLDDYKKNNKPPFQIKIWELKELENLTAGKKDLRIKYGLPTDVAFIPILNRYHVIYSMKPQLNTIDYLLELMDSLDENKRDEAFSMTYFDIVRPRFREPITGEEKLIDLKIDEDNYEAFREKCLSMKSDLSLIFVHKLVSSTLAWLFNSADKTSLADMQKIQKSLIESLKAEIEKEEDDIQRQRLIKMIDMPKNILEELPHRVEKSYQLYTYICNELVRKLLAERPIIHPNKKMQRMRTSHAAEL